MINTENFEIPDFCATDTRQCTNCSTVSNSACAANFGVSCPPTPSLECTCHDICVEEVRLIGLAGGTCEFNQCFNYPPVGPCRLGAGVTLPTINTAVQPKVFVVCAQEVLDSSCQVVNVQIQVLVLAFTTNGCSILIPLTITIAFDTFFRFPDCTTEVSGDALQNALTEIDGSCLVIQLRAFFRSCNGITQIVLTGKIVDKLWKHENLWVEGIRPYDLNDAQRAAGFVSFTVPDIFNNTHKIGPCVTPPCPCPPF